MGRATSDRRQPGGMHERKADELGKDRDVVRMPYPAIGTARYHAKPSRVKYTDIPMAAEGAYDPESQERRRRKRNQCDSGKSRAEGPLEDKNLQQRTRECGHMEHRHHWKRRVFRRSRSI